MRLLIVDDSALIRTAIQAALKGEAIEIVGEAADGEEALRLFREKKPDCVTLDISMPGMDGLTALREMLKSNAGARILITSGISSPEVIQEALMAGARYYLNKPFTVASLKAALSETMA